MDLIESIPQCHLGIANGLWHRVEAERGTKPAAAGAVERLFGDDVLRPGKCAMSMSPPIMTLNESHVGAGSVLRSTAVFLSRRRRRRNFIDGLESNAGAERDRGRPVQSNVGGAHRWVDSSGRAI